MFKHIDFKSLKTILVFAFIFRMIAAIFSEGYGMHDDHFLIVEASASWVDGFDYNHWLPWSPENQGVPEGHSFTYVGLNYFFFAIAKFFGVIDPYLLMIFNRMLHGLFSLLIVYFGFKITEKLASKKEATQVGWVLSLLWILPFFSVRNLVEFTSIPFLMWGVWLLVNQKAMRCFFFAGILLGMAVSFRYQIGVFAIGIAAFYFFQWKWRPFLLFCSGVLLTFILTQGLVDYLIWGYPFAELISYVSYNMTEGTEYMPNTNYFMYFYVLFGLFLFPMAIFAFAGFFTMWKKQVLLFLPTLLFILFHTVYPNRQERFVLTVFPIVVILAIMGIERFKASVKWERIIRFSWILFWILNIPLLVFFSFTSTKISRVDAMYALYDNGMSSERILVEASGKSKLTMYPSFYGKCWTAKISELDENTANKDSITNQKYDYIFFVGEDSLVKRKTIFTKQYPNLKLVKACQPSAIDRVLHTLNPRNSNEYIEVWETRIRK